MVGEEIVLGAKPVQRVEVLAELRGWLKCEHCKLVQFVSRNGACRRCKKALVVCEPSAPKPPESVRPVSKYAEGLPLCDIVREERERRGLSRRQLAVEIGVSRQWILKIEKASVTPNARSICRIAAGLGLAGWELLKLAEERGAAREAVAA